MPRLKPQTTTKFVPKLIKFLCLSDKRVSTSGNLFKRREERGERREERGERREAGKLCQSINTLAYFGAILSSKE